VTRRQLQRARAARDAARAEVRRLRAALAAERDRIADALRELAAAGGSEIPTTQEEAVITRREVGRG